MLGRQFLQAGVVFGGILIVEICVLAQDTTIVGLKGKVQTALTEESTSNDGANREPVGSTLDVYDPAGYKLQSFLYKSDGSLWAHTVFDRDGPRVFRVDVMGIPDNDGTRVAPFEPHSEQTLYDSEGHEIERDVYGTNGVLISKSTYNRVDPNSTMWTKTTHESESKTLITEITDPQTGITHQVGTKNGQLAWDWLIQPERDGAVEDKSVEPDGSYTEEERKSDGSMMQQEAYNAKTRVHCYSKFDSHGHEVELIFRSASNYTRYTYSYDKAGRRIGEIDYDATGRMLEKSTVQYRDDSHGNWIEKRSIVWNTKTQPMLPKTVNLSVRTITYY